MTIDLLERGAAALGDLVDQVAFVGGATIVLWITDPGAPPPRPTKDVDVVIEVTTPSAFHDFQARLRARGFHEDIDSGVICRWRYNDGSDDLILDAMPSAGELLGFENPCKRRRRRTPGATRCHPARRSARSSPVPDCDQAGGLQQPRSRRPPRQQGSRGRHPACRGTGGDRRRGRRG